MTSREEVTLPATRPKSRKSLGHVPSSQSMDQENMTTDFGALAAGKRAPIEKPSRKSRSKSIGPGGLDALKDATGNRRKSIATVPHPPPKSILKPTIPPLREIPAHISARKGSPKKATPPTADKTENLIDFDIDPAPGPTVSGMESLANPFEVGGSAAVNETRVTLRTEEEQQAAAREREEQERAKLEKEINSRRDARRKSLANRRVSFAPEATLHTWDVVVEYQDSTTSSNSTNSTRRASSVSGASAASPHPNGPHPVSSDPSEPPSTPPDQIEEETVTASPVHQRDLHQKKRRRSSGIPPMNFNNPEDDEAFSSSPFSGDSDGEAEEVLDDQNSNSNSDSGDDDGTMMSLDDGDTTGVSMASGSDASTGSSTRLEAALRQAAQQAGTQGIEFDENGDAELVEEEEGVVASFAPWAKKAPLQELESLQDQENINPFSASFKTNAPVDNGAASDEEEMTMDITRAVGGIIPGSALEYEDEDAEISMDVTKAFGGIISNGPSKMSDARRKSMPSNRRQSRRRRSSTQESSLGDETMDLTMAMGGIQRGQDETVEPEDEDMTMEFTSAVGGLLSQANASIKELRGASMASTQKSNRKARRESIKSDADDETVDMDMDMDMTVAMGSIMPSISKASPTEQDLEDEETMGMEITRALGAILKNPENRSEAKKIMELETDLGSSPFRVDPTPASPPKLPAPTHTIASETGSPSLAGFRGKGLRRSAEARQSTTPKTRLSSGGTPVKKPTTPSKQLTPQPPRPKIPGKTPPSKNVMMRTSSPKRLFKGESKVASSTPQSAASRKVTTPNKLFQKDVTTGLATPSFILTPQARRNSGVGLDKLGLGSPRVAALLDRRGSISAQARLFVPGTGNEHSHPAVRFEDPRAMEEEIDEEREIEEDRENGRSILEKEVDHGEDEKDVTLNLREMIQSLTPKKKPLRGRKSLHVGAAKGILGKRPIELDDEDEDDEDTGGVKRLKNFQGSPVKNVKLPAPPSKAETTTGRMTRAARKSLEESSLTPSITSPTKAKVTTPCNQSCFKNAEVDANIEDIMPPSEKTPQDNPVIDEESFGDERIQLQDFLNMTNIRFMELTTTKRRHTIAHKSANHSTGEDEKIVALEDCVAAGAATVPMLELYQHACKELKAYISEGRKTVREIEAETYDENPPLFREYISATPDIKSLMDNQLKNVKTHARLLSKGMWYDWRMTLLATLKDGLLKTAEGMIQDEEVLDRQQELLDTVVPHLIQKSSTLEREEQNLKAAADEIANCDQAELGDARQRLITVDADLEAKKQVLSDLRRQLERRDAEIQAGNQKKQVWLEEIHEAEKIREECRGWSSSEISILKAKVEALEKAHGWTITGISGTTTSMTYLKEIELVFDPSSFLPNNANVPTEPPVNTRIDLWYIGAVREHNPEPLTPEKEFFLQCIRDDIRGLPQAETPIKDLLRAVSVSWHKAKAVTDDIRLLKHCGSTETAKTSDDSIKITTNLVIKPVQTKVEISFHLTCQSGENGIDVQIEPGAKVIYGERFKEPSMGDFLLNRCGDNVEEKGQKTKMSWGDAVAELEKKLIARGRK